LLLPVKKVQKESGMDDFELAFPAVELGLEERGREDVCWDKAAGERMKVVEELIGGSEEGRDEVAAEQVGGRNSGMG
jgi:hypothetical protein